MSDHIKEQTSLFIAELSEKPVGPRVADEDVTTLALGEEGDNKLAIAEMLFSFLREKKL